LLLLPFVCVIPQLQLAASNNSLSGSPIGWLVAALHCGGQRARSPNIPVAPKKAASRKKCRVENDAFFGRAATDITSVSWPSSVTISPPQNWLNSSSGFVTFYL
jgi:hypothetical protein